MILPLKYFTYGTNSVEIRENRLVTPFEYLAASELHWSCPALQDVLQLKTPRAHCFEHSGRCEPDEVSHNLQRLHVSSQSNVSKYLHASMVNLVASSSSILKTNKLTIQ